jgi:hypothetical protein
MERPLITSVTARELLDARHWGDYCEKYGVWEWAINEGIMDDTYECEIEVGDAINWGFLDRP